MRHVSMSVWLFYDRSISLCRGLLSSSLLRFSGLLVLLVRVGHYTGEAAQLLLQLLVVQELERMNCVSLDTII